MKERKYKTAQVENKILSNFKPARSLVIRSNIYLFFSSNISSFHKDLKTISRTDVFIEPLSNRSVIKTFLVSDDMHSLTSKELEYIPKIVLLREFENCIDLL